MMKGDPSLTVTSLVKMGRSSSFGSALGAPLLLVVFWSMGSVVMPVPSSKMEAKAAACVGVPLLTRS
jgi:hypothetical protein